MKQPNSARLGRTWNADNLHNPQSSLFDCIPRSASTTLGTVAPLRLRVTFPTPVTVAAYRDASVPPRSAVEYVAGERQITEPVEHCPMTFMMLFGGWDMVESPTIVDDMMTGVTVTTAPIEPSGEGFDVVGALSSMYARYFDSGTRGPHGITALDPLLAPGTLAVLLPYGYDSTQLPLWRFILTRTLVTKALASRTTAENGR